MSDLRHQLHTVAAEPASELDTEALVSRAARRRRRRAVAVSAAAVAVVLAASGGVLAAQHGGSGVGSVRTRGSGTEETTAASSSSSSTSSTSSTTALTPVPSTGGGNTASPWQATPTTGLGMFDAVTMTGTGVPDGVYYAGQCPASARSGDLSLCTVTGYGEASNGQLTVTVHVFWWMHYGQIDCGASAGACIVGIESGSPKSTFAPVSFALSFDPAKRPTIDATPSTGLVDGQQIEVHGVHVGGGLVGIQECLAHQSAACTYAEATAGPDGTFTAAFSVTRVLHWGFHGMTNNTSVCGIDDDCVIAVTVTPNWLPNGETFRTQIEPANPVPIAFAPEPPPTSTTTTTTTTTTG